MREHGIDVPDPQVDEDGRLDDPARRRGMRLDRNGDDFREAREACGTPFGDAGPRSSPRRSGEQMQETMLEFAACMREHGVDMPDPDFSGGGGGLPAPVVLVAASIRGSETFQKAQEACQEILEDALPGGGLRVGPMRSGGS